MQDLCRTDLDRYLYHDLGNLDRNLPKYMMRCCAGSASYRFNPGKEFYLRRKGMRNGHDGAGHVVRSRVDLAEAVQVAAGLPRAPEPQRKPKRNEPKRQERNCIKYDSKHNHTQTETC